MLSRRRLLILLALLGIPIRRTLGGGDAGRRPSAEGESALPPHCEALSLVWNTQRGLIRAAELKHAEAEQSRQKEHVSPKSRWWFDADQRSWEVARPGEPGTFDTTHSFTVRYLIGGKPVAVWGVDTRDKEVTFVR